MILQSKSNLRSLSENTNSTCSFDSEIETEGENNITKFICDTKTTSSSSTNNAQYKNPNVNNYEIVISSNAQKCKNNLDGDCGVDENKTLYILKNSSIIEQNGNSFVI